MPFCSVLVVDDEPVQAAILGEILRAEGLEVAIQTDSEQALQLAQNQSFDLVISDLKMPKLDGIELLQQLRKLHPDLTVIITTAYGTIETAVRAMRAGAFDYVMKPFSKEELLITVQRALKHRQIVRENVYLKEELGFQPGAPPLIGTSAAMRAVHDMAAKIAQNDKATVLIQGETGTGKDLVARLIHQLSPRKDAPFIVVNCAAIPDGLMESEFFGHEKGAFTGAAFAKPGRFELAHGGTLFLDEVAELNASLQGKLLRVLQTREFERVGGTRTRRVDVRIIAATNKDLREEVRTHRFREDLFYRLNIVPITLPPLRDRKEDIPALAEFFLKKNQAEKQRHVVFSPDATRALMEYDYPGNVRELENVVERALILAHGTVITPRELRLERPAPDHLTPQAPKAPSAEATLLEIGRRAAEEAEKAAILDALRKTHWNRVKTAEALKVDYKTLRLKIRRYQLADDESTPPPADASGKPTTGDASGSNAGSSW